MIFLFLLSFCFDLICSLLQIESKRNESVRFDLIAVLLCFVYRLLRKFEILLPISEKKYLVTSKLPKDIPQYVPVLQDKFENSNRVTRRTYVFPYIPNGLWVRLITRTIIFADLTDESEKKKVRDLT